MKKRLESELISIAHRILKLKNKSEVEQLYHETQKLYETLSVLKFYNDNFEQLKSVISSDDLEEKIENSLVEKPIEKVEIINEKATEISLEEVAEEELEEQIEEITTKDEAEVVAEEILEEAETESPIIVGEIALDDEEIEDEIPVVDAKDALDFEPIFELNSKESEVENTIAVDENKVPLEQKNVTKKQEAKQISFEDLLGQNYSEPVFVKPNDIVTSIPKKEEIKEEISIIEDLKQVEKVENKIYVQDEDNGNQVQTKSTGIAIGLNDRIGFVKNLFGDVTEDFNRVISQLSTFDSFEEAQEFIEDMVKPDYDEWKGKEDYEERFMEIVAKKFE